MKIVSLVLVFVLALCVMAGCRMGNTDTTTATTTTTKAPTTATTATTATTTTTTAPTTTMPSGTDNTTGRSIMPGYGR